MVIVRFMPMSLVMGVLLFTLLKIEYMQLYYKLEGKEVVPTDNIPGDESFPRHIEKDYIGRFYISTVFLYIDHRYSDMGQPLLFETMIFLRCDLGRRFPFSWISWMGSFYCAEPNYQQRYSTYEEAEEGHKKAVEWAKRRTLKGRLKRIFKRK